MATRLGKNSPLGSPLILFFILFCVVSVVCVFLSHYVSEAGCVIRFISSQCRLCITTTVCCFVCFFFFLFFVLVFLVCGFLLKSSLSSDTIWYNWV